MSTTRTEEEEDIIYFEELDIQSGAEECSLSLIRKIIIERSLKKGVLKEVL